MTEKLEYQEKRIEISRLIRQQEEKINLAKNEIRKLETKLDNLCKHKMNDGSSAIKSESYWVRDIHMEENSWTGEMEEHDYGYTDSTDVCKICGKEFE